MVKFNKKKSNNKISPVKHVSRKELRKQKLLSKKEHKRLYFSSKNQNNIFSNVKQQQIVHDRKDNGNKKSPKYMANVDNIPMEQLLNYKISSNNDESVDSDFSDQEVDELLPESLRVKKKSIKSQPPTKKAKQKNPSRPNIEETRRKELQRQKELENAAKKRRIKQLKQENEEEDKIIAKLEKKLGLNKTKNKNRLIRKMFNDGLDFALELCLDLEEDEEKQVQNAKLKEKFKNQEKEPSWSDEEQDEEKFNAIFGNGAEYDDSEDEISNFAVQKDSENKYERKENEFYEDIYGRKRDKEGNVIKVSDNDCTLKYIPPHQRALQGENKQTQDLERLRKQCKGLLNRLSEANLHKISTGIEELYMKNSRFNMNETLNNLLQEALISNVITNERMVQEHIVLLAYLHAHIGSEIGAHFLQMFIEKFDEKINNILHLQQEDKSLNNVVLVLSYMYVFKIFEHKLLLEIIDRLSSKLDEKTIECLLLIFQSVGFKLRKDDPLAFKQMMLSVQTKIAVAPLELKENLRLKFMVDILNAVKNNNINKIPKFDPLLHENLRKKLKAMLRNDKYVITLSISMDDLLRADSVGKWWIVGSAWMGHTNEAETQNNAKADGNSSSKKQKFSEQLLMLAKHQKMNTEERRNIFCIIMGAADYMDAFEKVMHLAVKDQRSIAYVTIHCCVNEKASNPYYAHLALKFCNYNRKYQLAFQFACWDRINEIDSLNKVQVRNLARFLQYLIINNGLQLAVLKIVDFLQLGKQSFAFMKEICKGLLLSPDEQGLYQAFERLAKNSKLQQFKQSLRLFLQHFLLKGEGVSSKLNEEQMDILQRRIDYIDKLIAYVDF